MLKWIRTHLFKNSSKGAEARKPRLEDHPHTPIVGLPDTTCPSCHHRINAGVLLSGTSTPKCGDVGLCYGCGAVLEFNRDLKLCLISEAGWNSIPKGVQMQIVNVTTLTAMSSRSRSEAGGIEELFGGNTNEEEE